MTDAIHRKRLPDTRPGLTHKFKVGEHKGYITVGLSEEQQPMELFITMSKEGSTIGGLMDSLALVTSMALQHGVPLETLVKHLSFQRFEPSGFTNHDHIKHATSLVDYVFRWLGCTFIKDYKRVVSEEPETLGGA